MLLGRMHQQVLLRTYSASLCLFVAESLYPFFIWADWAVSVSRSCSHVRSSGPSPLCGIISTACYTPRGCASSIVDQCPLFDSRLKGVQQHLGENGGNSPRCRDNSCGASRILPSPATTPLGDAVSVLPDFLLTDSPAPHSSDFSN